MREWVWTEMDEAEFLVEVEKAKVRNEAERAEQWRIEREEEEALQKAAEAQAGRLRQADERRREQSRFEVPFLKTSVAVMVDTIIKRCLRYGQNGLILGEPGVGKTRALKEALRRYEAGEGPEVALVTITGITGNSLREVFREIGPPLGVEPIEDNAAMLRRLEKSVTRFPVLLFDEAQNLGYKQARELLTVSEATGIQMVFCGNSEMLKLVNTTQAAIQQISRRLPIREEIRCILDGDADLIASHFGVEGMDAHRLCREIGALFHADGVAKVLTVARDKAGKSKTIQLGAIRAALSLMPHFEAALKRDSAPKRVQRPSTLGSV